MNQPCVSSAVFRMVRRVHLYQRAHQIGAAGDLADALSSSARLVSVVGRSALWNRSFCRLIAWICALLGHHPERIELLRLRDPERIVGAQPAIAVVDAIVGIGDGDRRGLPRCRRGC